MKKLSTRLTIVVVMAILSGCAGVAKEGISNQMAACSQNKMVDTASLDWSMAEANPIEITAKGRAFDSGVIILETGKPYLIRITNSDKYFTWFQAQDLFTNSAIHSSSYDGAVQTGNCPSAVMMASGKVAEFRIVPVKKGLYEFSSDPRVTFTPSGLLNMSRPGTILVN